MSSSNHLNVVINGFRHSYSNALLPRKFLMNMFHHFWQETSLYLWQVRESAPYALLGFGNTLAFGFTFGNGCTCCFYFNRDFTRYRLNLVRHKPNSVFKISSTARNKIDHWAGCTKRHELTQFGVIFTAKGFVNVNNQVFRLVERPYF